MGRPLPVLASQVPHGRRSNRPTSFEDIVAHYRTEYASGAELELAYFRRLGSLKEVLKQAGLARGPNGKKFRHQFRIPNQVLQRSADALVTNVAAIQRCESFEELIRMVE